MGVLMYSNVLKNMISTNLENKQKKLVNLTLKNNEKQDLLKNFDAILNLLLRSGKYIS